MEERIFLIYI